METIDRKRKIRLLLQIICCIIIFIGCGAVECLTTNNEPQVTESKELAKSIKRKTIRKNNFIRLVKSSQRWMDVRELTGNNDHPMITRAMRLCGLDGDKGYYWCAACWTEIYEYEGMANPRSARVTDWFMTNVVWCDRWGEIPEQYDVRGMMGGVYYPRLNRYAHIVFIVGEDRNNYYTYQGNTSALNAVKTFDGEEIYITEDMIVELERNGQGFYKKVISKQHISVLSDYCVIGKAFSDEYDWYLLKFYN